MAAGDLYEFNVDMTYGGQNCVNVHHFVQNGPDGSGLAQVALHAMWLAVYRTPLRAIMTNEVNIVQTRIRRLQPTQTQQTITAVGSLGTHTGTALPPHAACLLRQRGTPSNRKGTGGVKIVGVPEGQVLAGVLEVAYAALVQTYGDVSESDQTDGGTGYVWRSAVYSIIDNTARLIEKSKVTPRIVTVHSRQIGVGQ